MPPGPRSNSTRDRLLAVALPLFAERNLEGVSIRQIAAAAGQNIATISYHFGGKDGLYLAVLEMVITELYQRVAPILEELRPPRLAADILPSRAIVLLKRTFRRMFESALVHGDDMAIARLIVREQTRPTVAFELIYDRGFRRVHEALTTLIASATGESPTANHTIIRTHALLGQVLGFMITRETIRRRLNHPVLTPADSRAIITVIDEHIDLTLGGIRRRRRKP